MGHNVDIRSFPLGLVAMGKRKELDPLDNQLSFGDNGVGLTGQWMLKKADEWIRANPSVWSDMMRIAADYVAHERRFSMEMLLQYARYERVSKGVTAFKVDNNIRSALRKRMVELHPQWDKFIEKRDSKVDWL